MRRAIGGIYGITSGDFGMSHEKAALAYLQGGVRIVQYREKQASARIMIEEAKAIGRLCKDYGATFIVDDRVDVAIAADADGVHIGQDDMPIAIVRKLFPGKIIGVSAKTPEQAIDAEKGGATYLGVGTIFPTNTKVKTVLIGVEGFKRVRESTKLPLFCIGGMKHEHIRMMKESGADGIAVITSILGADDPIASAKSLVKEWDGT